MERNEAMLYASTKCRIVSKIAMTEKFLRGK